MSSKSSAPDASDPPRLLSFPELHSQPSGFSNRAFANLLEECGNTVRMSDELR